LTIQRKLKTANENTSKSKFFNKLLIAAIDRGVGALKETRLSRARESWFSRGDKYVTLRYETTWERTKGEERFIFVIRQGQATLDSYKVTAPYPTFPPLP
ncbi:MAG: hypothetical protein WA224_17785, partial [Candidatus Acidiferrales bacterium]